MTNAISANAAVPTSRTVKNLDETTTEFFDVAASEENLVTLIRELFEQHWNRFDFGPCIQGAVFELRFATKPKVNFLDGYFTIGEEAPEGEEKWHFHLCVGAHRGTKARPTPPELEAVRRCARAAFYRDHDRTGRPSSWGFRLWNGKDEQMMTIFFPNPWLNDTRTKIVKVADWSKLDLWMQLRARFALVPAEPPPVVTDARPAMH